MKFKVIVLSQPSIVVEANDKEEAIDKVEKMVYSKDVLREFAARAFVVGVEKLS